MQQYLIVADLPGGGYRLDLALFMDMNRRAPERAFLQSTSVINFLLNIVPRFIRIGNKLMYAILWFFLI